MFAVRGEQRIRKSPGHGGEDRGFLGSIWGEPSDDEGGHRAREIAIPAVKFHPLYCDFFSTSDGNLPLEMWGASVSPRWPIAFVGDFSRKTLDGGKLGEGPVVHRAFLFSDPSAVRALCGRSTQGVCLLAAMKPHTNRMRIAPKVAPINPVRCPSWYQPTA